MKDLKKTISDLLVRARENPALSDSFRNECGEAVCLLETVTVTATPQPKEWEQIKAALDRAGETFREFHDFAMNERLPQSLRRIILKANNDVVDASEILRIALGGEA